MIRKKIINKIVIGLLIVLIGIQYVPSEYNQSELILETDISNTLNVPKDIQKLFETSCYDCHSNNTRYPWYNIIQPFKWIMEKHVKKGKKELNFSEFGAYSIRRMKSKFKSISSQIDDGEMPITSYTFLHRDAKLTETDKKRILTWVNKQLDSI